MTDKAYADVDTTLLWFQQQSASVAGQHWVNLLWKALETLEIHPDRCPAAMEAEDLGVQIYELSFGKRRGQYRILFKISGKTVHILRVWHSARDQLTGDDL